MKTRSGFVSNSSSSSFIVIFDKMPKSIDELKEMMFPDESLDSRLDYYDNASTVNDIVQRVWDDIQKTKDPNTGNYRRTKSKEIIDELINHEYVDYDNPEINKIKEEWNQYDREFNGYWQSLRNKYDNDFLHIVRELSNDWRIKDIPFSLIWKCFSDNKIALLNKSHSNEVIRNVCRYKLTHKDFFIDRKSLLSIKKRMSEHDKQWRRQWRLEDIIRKKNGLFMYKKFKQENKGKKIVILSYGDENGSFDSVMEHGEIFRNVNHIQVSHH